VGLLSVLPTDNRARLRTPRSGRLLDVPDVDYVNVRNTEAGCFVARIDRVPA
jgi:hypothetical protein